MKKLIALVVALIMFGALYNWYTAQQAKDKLKFTAENIPAVLEKYELYLKPQIHNGNYPVLNGFKPQAYELLDGGVYIYDFKDKEKLNNGKEQVQKVFERKIYTYAINNILVIYWTGTDDPIELTNEINTKLKKIFY